MSTSKLVERRNMLDQRLGEGAEQTVLESDAQLGVLMSMVTAAEASLADTLLHVAHQAAAAVPEADGVCVTVIRPAGGSDRVATSAVAQTLDERQAALGEGPTIDFVRRRRSLLSTDLGQEHRWPRLAAHLGPADPRSALVLPLRSPAGVVGTLSLYSVDRAAFDDDSRLRGLRLTDAVVRVVQHALALERARQLSVQPRLSGADRETVDQAVAVLMEEGGVRADEAYGVLRLLSRTEGQDLPAVARTILAAGLP